MQTKHEINITELFFSALEDIDSMPLDESPSGELRANIEPTEFVGLFFEKNVSEVHVRHWYRGDSRAPKQIFPEGFTARGTCTDLLLHVVPPCDAPATNWYADSAYVSTTTSKKVASTFPKELYQRGFIYEIKPQQNAIDVRSAFKHDPSLQEYKDFDYIKFEKEMAVPYKIKSQDIKGVWPFEVVETGILNPRLGVAKKTYIPNPNYVPLEPQYWKGMKMMGRVAIGVGVVVDGFHLHQAYQESNASGDYTPLFNEAARVIGGWSGAVALGTTFGKAGVVGCAPLLPPYGSLACGVTGGIIGSVIGYLGGAELGDITYSIINQDRSKHRFVTPDYVSKDRMEKESGDFLYVISEKGKLMLAKQTSLSMNESGHYLPASHMDLARGKHVLGAGIVHVQEGKIVRIDNHAPDYDPVDLQNNYLKSVTERAFQMNGFADVHDKFVYAEPIKSSNTKMRVQESSAHHSDVQAILEKKDRLLSSQSLFSSQKIYTDSVLSLNHASTMRSQQRRPSQSLLSPVDFDAHKSNFSQLISKQRMMPAPRVSTNQQQFFGTTLSSVGSTFNVTSSDIRSMPTTSDSVKEPTILIKMGDGPWR